MVTYSTKLRQGLPRLPGGQPWPTDGIQARTLETPLAAREFVNESAPAATHAASDLTQNAPASVAPVTASTGATLRQGLPRIVGGEPWPTGGVAAGFSQTAQPVETSAPDVPVSETSLTQSTVSDAEISTTTSTPASVAKTSGDSEEFVASDVPLRRGLPRTPGGKSWPATGFTPAQAAKTPAPQEATQPQVAAKTPTDVASENSQPAAAKAPTATRQGLATQTGATPTITNTSDTVEASEKSTAASGGQKPNKPASPRRKSVMIGEKTLSQWAKLVTLGAFGAVVAAAILVLSARGLTTVPGVTEFMERYPGEYDLPAAAEPGFPWWARWSHALNIFLIVLIIRSGMLVRTQQKPPAYWTPKKGGKKISFNLWLHTSLDVLWLVNGVIFVVLLFASGHWMRIIPTSWEVFPNALSAMIQYATLDWPVEVGWANYNSIQQLMYFTVVFIAAPLATITGLRMSEWWPEKATKLNKLYPAPLARAIHFPTMIFFVLFIVIHVMLVFSTGALRNLNYMFAGTDVVNWTGFWLFALTIFITVVGWFAARPLVLAPIASVFGRVSNR